MRKTIIHSKKYFKSIVFFIIVSTIIFVLLNQFFIKYRINSFININIEEVKEVKIIQKDFSVTKNNKYRTKEVNLKDKEEIKNLIIGFNEVKLKRNFHNELLYKLGQWVSYPQTTSSISYMILINTLDKSVEIVLTSGNTYIDLNVLKIEEYKYDNNRYFLKVMEGYDDRFLKELFN